MALHPPIRRLFRYNHWLTIPALAFLSSCADLPLEPIPESTTLSTMEGPPEECEVDACLPPVYNICAEDPTDPLCTPEDDDEDDLPPPYCSEFPEDPGCGGGGDDGSGSGGGGGGGWTAPGLLNDAAPLDTLIVDCSHVTNDQASAWCLAGAPDSVQLQITNAAINRIDARGGICSDFAAEARRLLAIGLFKYFEPSGPFTYEGGYGNASMGVLIQGVWARKGTQRDSHGRNIDSVIVHEVEHAHPVHADHFHYGPSGIHSKNELLCDRD